MPLERAQFCEIWPKQWVDWLYGDDGNDSNAKSAKGRYQPRPALRLIKRLIQCVDLDDAIPTINKARQIRQKRNPRTTGKGVGITRVDVVAAIHALADAYPHNAQLTILAGDTKRNSQATKESYTEETTIIGGLENPRLCSVPKVVASGSMEGLPAPTAFMGRAPSTSPHSIRDLLIPRELSPLSSTDAQLKAKNQHRIAHVETQDRTGLLQLDAAVDRMIKLECSVRSPSDSLSDNRPPTPELGRAQQDLIAAVNDPATSARLAPTCNAPPTWDSAVADLANEPLTSAQAFAGIAPESEAPSPTDTIEVRRLKRPIDSDASQCPNSPPKRKRLLVKLPIVFPRLCPPDTASHDSGPHLLDQVSTLPTIYSQQLPSADEDRAQAEENHQISNLSAKTSSTKHTTVPLGGSDIGAAVLLDAMGHRSGDGSEYHSDSARTGLGESATPVVDTTADLTAMIDGAADHIEKGDARGDERLTVAVETLINKPAQHENNASVAVESRQSADTQERSTSDAERGNLLPDQLFSVLSHLNQTEGRVQVVNLREASENVRCAYPARTSAEGRKCELLVFPLQSATSGSWVCYFMFPQSSVYWLCKPLDINVTERDTDLVWMWLRKHGWFPPSDWQRQGLTWPVFGQEIDGAVALAAHSAYHMSVSKDHNIKRPWSIDISLWQLVFACLLGESWSLPSELRDSGSTVDTRTLSPHRDESADPRASTSHMAATQMQLGQVLKRLCIMEAKHERAEEMKCQVNALLKCLKETGEGHCSDMELYNHYLQVSGRERPRQDDIHKFALLMKARQRERLQSVSSSLAGLSDQYLREARAARDEKARLLAQLNEIARSQEAEIFTKIKKATAEIDDAKRELETLRRSHAMWRVFQA